VAVIRWLRRRLAYLILAAGVVFALYLGDRDRGRVEALATATNGALCELRGDLERRHNDLATYLADVRAGKRRIIEGVTVGELERELAGRRDSLDSLAGLRCEGDG
jgi:hypothetical protein